MGGFDAANDTPIEIDLSARSKGTSYLSTTEDIHGQLSIKAGMDLNYC